MALTLPSNPPCKLCEKIIEIEEDIVVFDNFLPFDHKFGKFSNASFHKSCIIADPDYDEAENMHYVWKKIMASRPPEIQKEKDINEWAQEVLKDWPPKNGVVVYESLDGDDWWYADKYMWEEFEKAEQAEHDKMEKLRKEAREEERRIEGLFLRDDY